MRGETWLSEGPTPNAVRSCTDWLLACNKPPTQLFALAFHRFPGAVGLLDLVTFRNKGRSLGVRWTETHFNQNRYGLVVRLEEIVYAAFCIGVHRPPCPGDCFNTLAL